ncbi:CTP synthase [Candidatus Falkowbacteria bacterium RIFOXYD2_FULL_35_9]|uniref:CTP synthase n=1 Tax=Candidatus Falkowbacteria bacterium RIFOXYC2_FULL_36_12 TaxID=1798002 RepID=A0A1F5SW37_9BACT|nr:MAG: CTP synthase [Candidatus Falkowbacteria bacterium RIFOXYC2_FULL_36_12]OGF32992.1 MAG: CTP synthase [Candidatus Falkowbacteria bacterium RIFOXYA2_FULL_35_8]OGF48155.1 MAG: CTP synthase [Candidatus Falkowbacteria bacterium RIFOXYD2_FULL_35_9]
MSKYVFVVGGVMSGVGKGIAVASIGRILQAKGYSVTAIKIDPYINVDAGTMNPTEHGEVFVTEDGDETDQDLGNYERFLGTNIYSINYMTTGRVYQSVIERERNLEYGGKCVEVVPHIPEEIIDRITKAGKKADADITIVEVGGTVGEYQNMLFLEAARMMKMNNISDVVFVLVSFLPIPSKIGEMKTKPTQYAIRTLNSAGIQPDFVICRAEQPIDDVRKKKIALNGNMFKDHIISAPDIEYVYEVPLNFEKENLGDLILKKFGWSEKYNAPGLKNWEQLVSRIKNATEEIKIGIVGKYFHTGDYVLTDSYISVIEAVKHACWKHGRKPKIDWLDSGDFEQDESNLESLRQYHAVIVPGGFGSRGIEGKINAIKFVRENKIPYLGLCYGMQLATIEFARNVLGIHDATSTEINDQSPNQVIHLMADQVKNIEESNYGSTMRLGAYPCVLDERSKSYIAYKEKNISERHRHRYEFNNDFRQKMEQAGMLIAGVSPDNRLVEIIELPEHPFFVGVQFHPEFKSRPLEGHPLFNALIEAGVASMKPRLID